MFRATNHLVPETSRSLTESLTACSCGFDCNLECEFCDTAYTWAVTDEKAAKTRSGHRYDRDDPSYGRKLMAPGDVLSPDTWAR